MMLAGGGGSVSTPLLSILFLTLTCSWLPLGVTAQTTWGTTAVTTREMDSRYAEIVFDGLYHLEFPRNRLRRFHDCMCNSSVEACIIEYEEKSSNSQNSEDGYRFVAQSPIDFAFSTPVNDDIPFLCHPGGFTAFDTSLACVRVRDTEERCRHQTCQIVHVSGLPSRSCSVGCITVVWFGYSVSFRNFTDNREFQDGACGDTTASKAVPLSTEQPQVTSEASREKIDTDADESKDNKTLIIVAAIGWSLLVLTTILIISFFVYRRKTGLKSNENAPFTSRSLGNSYLTHTVSREVSSPRLANQVDASHTQIPHTSSSRAPSAYAEMEDVYTFINDGDDYLTVATSNLDLNGTDATNADHTSPTCGTNLSEIHVMTGNSEAGNDYVNKNVHNVSEQGLLAKSQSQNNRFDQGRTGHNPKGTSNDEGYIVMGHNLEISPNEEEKRTPNYKKGNREDLSQAPSSYSNVNTNLSL